MIERIAQKHVGVNVPPEHDPAVAQALLVASPFSGVDCPCSRAG